MLQTLVKKSFASAGRLARAVVEPRRLRLAVARRLAGQDYVANALGAIEGSVNRHIACIPDRFSLCVQKYLERGHPSILETRRKFEEGNEANNRGDYARFYFLTLACDMIVEEGIRGDVAELGVYKGNTAFLLAQLARRIDSTAYLFDTFKGFSDRDLVGRDAGRPKQFGDTSIADVKKLVGESRIEFVPGQFPESTSAVKPDLKFCFVHLDCDLYRPFRAALDYFYPRLVPGAFLVMHDYSSLYWEGVEQAVNEFFADKREFPIPVPDKSGTAVVRKV
jgi:Macrocin-O-methyltransferase (TylF)